MRYVILLLLGFGLSLIAFGLVATPGAPLAAGEPYDPGALFGVADTHLRTVQAAASQLLHDLVERFTAPYRELIQRNMPSEPLLQ